MYSPYRFLAGYEPVSNTKQVFSSGENIYVCFDADYAFPADFKQINAAAKAELVSSGLVQTRDRYSGYKTALYRHKGKRQTSHANDSVILYKEMRYRLPQHGEPYSVVGYDAPGWVSVQVHVELAPDEGGLQLMRTMLQEGFDINAEDSRMGNTLLHEAAQIGSVEVVRLLLEHGADVDATDAFGDATPLLVAVRKDRIEVIRVLLERGADVNRHDVQGKTALMYAQEEDRQDLVKLLRAAGAKEFPLPEPDDWKGLEANPIDIWIQGKPPN